MRPRLQAKLTAQANELTALRSQISETQRLVENYERKVEEAKEEAEYERLEREILEERFNELEAEAEDLRERVVLGDIREEVRLEAELAAEGESVPEEDEAEVDKRMKAVLLEKQNERLKEALLKLRDMSADAETEHRRTVAELERELQSFQDEGLRGTFCNSAPHSAF